MAYRCIMVENKAHLSIRQRHLVIAQEDEHTIPLEDVSALLVESRQSTFSSAALATLAQRGIALLVCDEKHLPCGVLLPYAQHSRHLQVVKRQLALTKPKKNRLWQQVVSAKINNQGHCLRLMGHEQAADNLFAMSRQVQSGDKGYLEGTAAAQYFLSLFGKEFRRGQENGINAALNYGYAILRGCVARTLAAYGLLLCHGLQHCSELNAMNLADDILEPFRPLVDLYVVQNVSEDELLSPSAKRGLFALLGCDILSDNQHHSVPYAIERLVQSLMVAINFARVPPLTLPVLVPLARHQYE